MFRRHWTITCVMLWNVRGLNTMLTVMFCPKGTWRFVQHVRRKESRWNVKMIKFESKLLWKLLASSSHRNTKCTNTMMCVSRDSAVGIATGYGLDDWEVGVRVPVGSRIFTSSCCPDWLWGPPNLLYNGFWDLFPGGKAAGAWSWPLTSNYCRGQENVDLYIHYPICLHGVVLN
jgi:hypothetical protein